MPFGGQSIRSCSSQIKLRHGEEAKFIVSRQAQWARDRGNDEEIAFWNAVLSDLDRKTSPSAKPCLDRPH
ncbi:MAG: hypothetical protein JHC57_08600 [Sphingopyxis sp.]|uniref:hypothetical protein n=1 Tax=Sphingopyxis sp. TaxID=1908224 RepID=UPI001A35484B|nr:hypothetical protein [Sphingopyxis sp.]MBJ7499798.1 hypothetical protein [Sphingopyxis sp.]